MSSCGTATASRLLAYNSWSGMDVEKTIAEIEWLERLFALPDARSPQLSEREAANRRHDEMLAANPWFRLWQRYGVCTRSEPHPSSPYPELKSFNPL